MQLKETRFSLYKCCCKNLFRKPSTGVQAQTMSNFFLAFEQGLHVIPVLNKVDLENSDPEACREELLDIFDIQPEDCIEVSAKSGHNVETVIK